MKPTWVIQREVGSNGVYEAMLAHFAASGIPHHVIRIVPFSHEVEGDIPKIVGPVVNYGSLGMRKVAAAEGWRPGVWESRELGETATRDALGDLYLNADLRRMKLSEVWDWWRALPVGTDHFIKPDGDAKIFSGAVMTLAEFGQWDNRLRAVEWFKGEDPMVVLSSPKRIGHEWRIVMVDGEVSDASLYMRGGMVLPQRGAPDEVLEFAKFAHRPTTPPVYVLDIAESADGLKVVERNTFNHSGLYAIDVAKVVDDINAFVERQSKVTSVPR